MAFIPSITIILSVLTLLTILMPPSYLVLLIFLLCVSLLGYRIACIFFSDREFQVYVSIVIGLAISTISLLVPFGILAQLPLSLNIYIGLLVVGSSVALDINDIRLKSTNNASIRYLGGKLRIAFSETKVRQTFLIFLIGLVLRLLFQSFNGGSILPDAALYYTAGRSLAEDGLFSSNVLNDVPITSPISKLFGLVPRTGTWLLMGTFFSYGSVSLATLNIMLAILGSLVTFPAALLSKKWFNEYWWVGTSIIALHPVLIFFSAVPFGPELVSLVFGVYGLAVLESRKTEFETHYPVFLLAGIFWGISLVAWDPNAVMLFLLPYSLYFFFTTRDKLVGIINVFLVLGLEANILFSLTWYIQPIIYTIVLLHCCVLFLKKRANTQFCTMLVVISACFTIWLNRWYLYPDLIIEPSLNYGSRATPVNYISGGILSLSTLENTFLYLQVLLYSVTILLAGSAFLAIFFIRRKNGRQFIYPMIFLIVHAGLSILYFVPGNGLFFDLGASRLFLGQIFFVSLLSGYAIGRIGKFILYDDQTCDFSTFRVSSNKPSKIGIVIILLLLVPLAANFYSMYKTSYNYIEILDYTSFMGINDSRAWVLENSRPGDIFLVASGQTSRVWAMSIGDRLFASLFVEYNSEVVPYENVTLCDLIDEARRLNASFIIFDRMINAFHLDKLLPLYNRINTSNLGKSIPIVSENSTLEQMRVINQVDSLTPLFIEGVGSSKVIIFGLSKLNLNITWGEDFINLDEWNLFLGGAMNSTGGVLEISRECDNEKVYAKYDFTENITITSEMFVILNVVNQDENARSGFFLFFQSGVSIYQKYVDSGVHIFSLEEYEGLVPQYILLYNLSGEKTPTSAFETVAYEWISITNTFI